jgi:hypothetical protein
MLDFEIVEKQIKKKYPSLSCTEWTLEDYISVFRYYYDMFKFYRHKEHPILSTNKIGEIMWLLPRFDNDFMNGYAIAEMYPEYYIGEDMIIDKYFNTRFKNCDYSICHFISGNIRMLRFYECGLY